MVGLRSRAKRRGTSDSNISVQRLWTFTHSGATGVARQEACRRPGSAFGVQRSA